ncbi:glycoside hydrolase [Fibrisoma montanum]|uniref:Glycoside hydrolase n=1 Tax=Fibrisoma montanum TaxID=2305895 RepID=A0A418MJP9_9BACT|nr:family 10 glycosylhydrolase [Fibrisoma montanum]RIV27634.1 glycoside hydrolase [Fibrisoma montanum]
MYRSVVCLALLLAVFFWNGCRRPKPVVTKKPPVSRPKATAVKPDPAKPASTTAVAAKPVPTRPPVVATTPVDTVETEELTALVPLPPKREFRAVWIATVDNIDWPSKKGLLPADQQQEIVALFDQQQQMGLNAVVVQIRAAADAFYAKSSEPWSEWLMGQQGLAPEPFYDPLDFMIEQAHSRNMEFHAWFNLDRATFSKTASVAPSNIVFRKPGWFLEYGGRKLFNLGLPEVRSYIASVVANVVRNYDVDGIHFDDYFYPYAIAGQVLRDDSTYQANYNGMKKADWRRDNVNRLVLELRDSIRANKPYVKFGISPFGIWKNQSSDPEGSATNGGQAYYELYADTRKWAREGWVDYIAPQVYFSTQFGRAPYRTLVEWWTRNCGNRHLYIGHGAYRVGRGSERDPGWYSASEFPEQLRYNRQQRAVAGSIYFSAKSLKTNPLFIRDSLRQGFYRYPALVPPMPWIDSIPPLPPRDLKAADSSDGIELFWQQPEPATDGNGAHYYVIYRFEGKKPRIHLDDPRHILAVCQGELLTRYVDKTADPSKKYVYAVTAFDRLHNESQQIVVKVR